MYICILDFEATCDDTKKVWNEIIEFPSVLYEWDVKNKSLNYIDEIQIFVKPRCNPILSKFCKELTGIRQDQVDNGISLPDALQKHYNWVKSHVDDLHNFYFVTCGNWDLITMLPNDCEYNYIEYYPKIYRRVINIKHIFRSLYGIKKGGMKNMLNYLGLKLEGRHHSGIDDCRNIGKIFINMVSDGYIFDKNDVAYVDYYWNKESIKKGKMIKITEQ